MSRNSFPQIERDYARDEDYREMVREERRKAQQERMIERGMTDAYEEVERTANCCDMEGLK